MRTVLHVAVVAFFVAWFVATVIKQFRGRAARAVQRCDRCSLVPQWTFFAPNPGRSDLHVLYRDVLADSTVTGWSELALAVPRSRWTTLWNPQKRRRKAVSDAASALAIVPKELVGPELMVSDPYVMLLALVVAANGRPDARFREFVIVATDSTAATAQPRVRLKSALHPV
jgi:hypothetical protein